MRPYDGNTGIIRVQFRLFEGCLDESTNNIIRYSWYYSGKVIYTSGTNPTVFPHISNPMYFTKGIEAVATITELRSKTSELVEHAKGIDRGILIQKNNEPYAVLISYDVYEELLKANAPSMKKKK